MKSVQIRSFSGPYFPIFSPNAEKHGPEKAPYLDTFHAVHKAPLSSFLLSMFNGENLPVPPTLHVSLMFDQKHVDYVRIVDQGFWLFVKMKLRFLIKQLMNLLQSLESPALTISQSYNSFVHAVKIFCGPPCLPFIILIASLQLFKASKYRNIFTSSLASPLVYLMKRVKHFLGSSTFVSTTSFDVDIKYF